MNTPRKRRRFNISEYMAASDAAPKGSFVHALTDAEYAKRLARIVSEFEHVETYMPKLLATLMGRGSVMNAAFVYRTLKNPQIRLAVMTTLLENSPSNQELGDDFTALLDDYDKARQARNAYVHGLWFTGSEGVFLARSDEVHGQGYRRAALEPIAKLDATLTLIRSILGRLVRLHVHGTPPRIAPPPRPPPQSEVPNQATKSRRHSASKSPEPPPPPLRASPRTKRPSKKG